MGYGFYELPDGRLAGYTVEAVCDYAGCKAEIDRGLGYLCGDMPDGHRDPDDPGCGKYFCSRHQVPDVHECDNAPCNTYPSLWEQAYECALAKGHELPHMDAYSRTFSRTEDEDIDVLRLGKNKCAVYPDTRRERARGNCVLMLAHAGVHIDPDGRGFTHTEDEDI